MIINTKLMDLPCKVRGFCTRSIDENGEEHYTIVLNSALSLEQQRETYLHELGHVERDDFSLDCTADAIERMAHDDRRTKEREQI